MSNLVNILSSPKNGFGATTTYCTMGGDGGTVAANRAYLRGAGKADHTADHNSSVRNRSRVEVEATRARAVFETCALTGSALDHTADDVVTCPYGKLYKKEEAFEALLRRSRTVDGGGNDDVGGLGTHIRGMRDLHPLKFHLTERGGMLTCPITGSNIGSGSVSSFVIVRNIKGVTQSNQPNVLSERAIKEMGVKGMQAEYGPFEERDMIRLAPSKTIFEDIRTNWEERMKEAQIAKSQKKDKKRKRDQRRGEDDEKPLSLTQTSPPLEILPVQSIDRGGGKYDNTQGNSAVDEARSNVISALAHNPVLSDLFGGGKEKKEQNEKEKAITLFTRNC